MGVDVPADADVKAVLLVALRAHGDKALHGRSIEGVAVGINVEVEVIPLRHP